MPILTGAQWQIPVHTDLFIKRPEADRISGAKAH